MTAETTGQEGPARATVATVSHVWRADPAEAEVVAGLLAQFRDWMGRKGPSDESLRSGVERLIADPHAEYLLGVTEAEGPPAGVCQLRFRHGIWHEATDCWLEDLFVNEHARGSGLGRSLVTTAAERARERGCARVELDVSESNPAAMALYLDLGFSTGKDSGTPDLLMRLFL